MLTSTIIRYSCLSLLLLLSTHVLSEVYQWTDQNGRIHFGDRPPEKTASKNISEKLDKINITSDYSSPDMMLRHEQSKDTERQQRIDEWKEKQKNKPSKAEKCQEVRQQLNVIKGPVVFVDDNGKDLKVSEETRKKSVQKLESIIRKHCQ
ncbi:DUF4124 domain-containing protein [Alkalimarinus alittae]|uniref:DUF4124 domain-containing protein n=1 Tax=Alkalimarinus alittae TaxID=2961619 RepID=A0ABY6MY94_9ALTE|nr:DUF4124 domain-containing protein [Alkalimarinus alittae]UZE94809.1 DUF4124 domain-containing protein [Alkalimarinus alittae]